MNDWMNGVVTTANRLGYYIRSIEKRRIELVAPGYTPTIVVTIDLEAEYHISDPEWRTALALVLKKLTR